MLTVKWIVNTPRGEVIRIFTAGDVTVASKNLNPLPDSISGSWQVSGREVTRALLIMDPSAPDYAGRSLDCGLVYVMNEHGATVGKYDLGDGMTSTDVPEPRSGYLVDETYAPAIPR